MAKITIDIEKCKGCFLCLDVCPKQLIQADEKLNSKGVTPVKFIHSPRPKAGPSSIAKGGCAGCCFCALICPDCCIEVYK